MRAQQGEINRVDATTSLVTKQVVSAVRADPAHGADSPLLARDGLRHRQPAQVWADAEVKREWEWQWR